MGKIYIFRKKFKYVRLKNITGQNENDHGRKCPKELYTQKCKNIFKKSKIFGQIIWGGKSQTIFV